jgi:SPASM domain peptide maturase of grasp-with-spasm system
MTFDFSQEAFLFTNCKIVKGAARSIVYDLQRERFAYIPNDLYEMFDNGRIPSRDDLISEYGASNTEVLGDYYDLLLKNEFIFQTNSPAAFPAISEELETPYIVHDAIVDMRSTSQHPFDKIKEELEALKCQHLEIRCFDHIPVDEFQKTVNLFKDSTIRSLSVTMPYNESLPETEYGKILNSNFRFMQLFLFNAPTEVRDQSQDGRIFYSEEVITDASCCGVIMQQYFRVSLPMFLSSKKENNCLNKKISIDENGQIKNCPSMVKSFGNINEMSLSDALQEKEFKAYWGVNKDQIDTCRDCEYRYMCSDCRVYVTDTSSKFSKPAKCSYDPYTATWN